MLFGRGSRGEHEKIFISIQTCRPTCTLLHAIFLADKWDAKFFAINTMGCLLRADFDID